jgi:hypothetical protein
VRNVLTITDAHIRHCSSDHLPIKADGHGR